MGKQSRVVVGLDIGTTKVSAVVGEVNAEGSLEVIGLGCRPYKGVHRGVIVDIDATVDTISAVLEDAQVMAGVRIDAVYAGLGGGQVEASKTEGFIEFATKEVTPSDIRQVIETTCAQLLTHDREILHVIPQEFTLDGQEGIPNPVGMVGTKLGMRAQVVTAALPTLQTFRSVIDLGRIEVREVVAQQLASGEAVLTEDEKGLGVALIDIGGGTSDIAVYSAGTLRHLSSVIVGGNHVTNDLAVGLRTSVAEAERLKKDYGCALVSLVQVDDMVTVPLVGGKESQVFPHKFLAEIVELRVEEIFALALHNIQQSGFYEAIPAGVVLTGGASVMPGMVQAAEAVFELPVRVGFPLQVGGLADLVHHPIYATGIGLALYGRHRLVQLAAAHTTRRGFGRVLRRVRVWFQGLL